MRRAWCFIWRLGACFCSSKLLRALSHMQCSKKFQSSAQTLCEDTLSKLPDSVWEHQTKTSLFAVTRELENRIEREGSKASVSIRRFMYSNSTDTHALLERLKLYLSMLAITFTSGTDWHPFRLPRNAKRSRHQSCFTSSLIR